MSDTRPHYPAGISAVIPVYDSAGTVETMVDRVLDALRATGQRHEVILVNDGSSDASWEVIRSAVRRHPDVRGFNLMRNYGQQNAILCGVRAATYDKTITLDDDLQYDPAELPALLDKLADGYDVVYGKERERHHSMGHNLGNWLLRLGLSVALGQQTAGIVSPFCLFRTKLRESFENNRSPWVVLDVFLSWGTTRIGHVEVTHHERLDGGKSRYSTLKRFSTALDLITGYSTLPLQFASLIGFVFTLFGIGLLAYVLSMYFFYGADSVPGWAFLASTIAIFSGAQLFALGIIGAYLARMFNRITERPPYAVAETLEPAQAVELRRGSDTVI